MTISRRAFLAGAATTALAPRHAAAAPACGSGPLTGAAASPILFTPKRATVAERDRVEKRLRRERSAPVQIGESLARVLRLREDIARGRVVPPPPAPSAIRPTEDADRRLASTAFDPV